MLHDQLFHQVIRRKTIHRKNKIHKKKKKKEKIPLQDTGKRLIFVLCVKMTKEIFFLDHDLFVSVL